MDISKISTPGTPKSHMVYHEDPENLHVNTLERHCILFLSEKNRILSEKEKTPVVLSF